MWTGQSCQGPGTSLGALTLSPTRRDVAWLGDCDQGFLALADLLGWKVRSLGCPSPLPGCLSHGSSDPMRHADL